MVYPEGKESTLAKLKRMRRLDRTHLLTILLVLLLAATYFRPRPEPPAQARATPLPSPSVTLPELPTLDGGLGGLGVKVNLQEGTYEYVVDPPPKARSSAVGIQRDKKAGPSLNIRLAP